MSRDKADIVHILSHSGRKHHKYLRSGTSKILSATSLLRRDVTKFDYGYQLKCIRANIDKLTKRLIKAAKAGDTLKVSRLSSMLASSKTKAQLIAENISRLEQT